MAIIDKKFSVLYPPFTTQVFFFFFEVGVDDLSLFLNPG